MRRIHDTNLVFIHIPKTGGQSVVDAFGLKHETADHYIDAEYLTDDYVRFCVMRHPIDRFVSAYKYNCNPELPRGNIRDQMHKHNLCNDINKFINYFQDNITSITDLIHFKPQSTWINTCRPVHILNFNNLEIELERVVPHAKKYYKGLTHINKSRQSKTMNISLNNINSSKVLNWYKTDMNIYNNIS